MGQLTTHVLDTHGGKPAAGLAIDLFAIAGDSRVPLKSATTNADGRLDGPLLAGAAFSTGIYELAFHAGDYLRAAGGRVPLKRRDFAAGFLKFHVRQGGLARGLRCVRSRSKKWFLPQRRRGIAAMFQLDYFPAQLTAAKLQDSRRSEASDESDQQRGVQKPSPPCRWVGAINVCLHRRGAGGRDENG